MAHILDSFHICFDACPIPCCVTEIKFDSDVNDDVFVYANKAFCELVDDKLENVIGNKSKTYFSEQSADEHNKIEEVRRGGEKRSFTNFTETGRTLAIEAFCPMAGLCAFIFHDITVHKSIIEDYENQLRLYRLSEYIGVFRANIDRDFTLEYANDRFYLISEYTRDQQIKGTTPAKCSKYIYKGDQDKLEKQVFDAVKNGEKYLRMIIRTITASGSLKSVKVTANIVIENDGSKHLEGTIIDITDQVKLANELQNGRKKIEQSRNEIAAAIEHSGIDMWQYNVKKGTMNYYIPSSFLRNIPEHLENYPDVFIDLGIIDRNSIDDFLQLHTDMKNGIGISEKTIKLSDEHGGGWFKVMFSNKLDNNGNSEIAYCTAENIDSIKENEEQFAIASKEQQFYIWKVDLLNNEMTISKEMVDIFGGKTVMEWNGVNDYAIEIVHPSDRETYKRLYRTVIDEKKTAGGRVRKMNKLTGKWDHLNMVLIPVFDKSGLMIKIIGSAKVINNLVESEENYKLIQHFTLSEQKGFIVMFKLNLTRNICTGGQTSEERFMLLQQSGTFDGFVEKSLEFIPYEIDKVKCREAFSRKKLLEMYSRGQRNISLEFRYKINNSDAAWVRTNLDMAENPETGDVEGVIYSREINEEKMNALVVDKLIESDFDLIATFPISTEELTVFLKHDYPGFDIVENGKYSDAMRATVLSSLDENNFNEALRRTELKTIIEELNTNSVYEVAYSTKLIDGISYRKKWEFMYLDDTKSVILITRSDITNIFEAMTAQEQALAEALRRAEVASVAKTEFLSRMSHEMRTPMNAIIGMASIAEQCVDDSVMVEDCIKKLGISAHELLDIINDVLDMSRLESGKSVVTNGRIDFTSIINDAKNAFSANAEARGIKFEIVSDDMTDRLYYSDDLKIKRIIFNLVSNAIKFTKENGTVKLTFKCKVITDSKSEVKIIVSDTGIGISDNFISKIFLPFEQENTGRTSEYSGTGLGLPICKNYVEMMGGTIDVKSTKNVGSVFTVTFNMKTKVMKNTENSNFNTSVNDSSINFSGKRILMCEDHPMNIAVATMLLSSKNAEVSIAENGQIGVNMFSERPQGYFDAVIMDIRMPVMDGLEATKEIRLLNDCGGDKIPIIAMSANANEDDIEIAKKAGVNDYITKPVNPSEMFLTLSKYI